MTRLLALCPPLSVVDCTPDLLAASADVFFVRNKMKPQNFIMADITSRGYFHFYVENRPKDKRGCPGWWLFQMAWEYFVQDQRVTIMGIRGDWTSGDNLETVNRVTAGNAMTLEEASKHTWTYHQAQLKEYTQFQYIDAQGSPGQFTSIDVVFIP